MDSINENIEKLSEKKLPNEAEEFNNFFFVGGDDWIKNNKENISKEKKNKIKLFLKNIYYWIMLIFYLEQEVLFIWEQKLFKEFQKK
ncbi:hypothetical protein LH399_05965 [Fusobacterium nucleatum]